MRQGSPGPGFTYAVVEGSREHVYALKRHRWRQAYQRWLAGGRLVMRLEPTPDPWTDKPGFAGCFVAHERRPLQKDRAA